MAADVSRRTCCNCQKVFSDPWALNRHLRKKRCPVIKEKVQEENEAAFVEILKREVTRIASAPHPDNDPSCNDTGQKPRSISEAFMQTVLEKIANLEQQNRELRDEMEVMKMTMQSTSKANKTAKSTLNVNATNNTMNVNVDTMNNNNIINPVFLVNFGQEDTSHISHADLMEWAKDPANGVISYVEKKHFDPSKPENQTIKLMSLKRDEVAILVDGAWQRKPARPIASKIVENTLDRLQCGVDWDTLSSSGEKYYDEVSSDMTCPMARETVQNILYLLDKYRGTLTKAQAVN